MKEFARFASTALVWTVVVWCSLTVMGLGSELDLVRAAARASILISGLLLWGLVIGGVG
jgi:hypothetical protein